MNVPPEFINNPMSFDDCDNILAALKGMVLYDTEVGFLDNNGNPVITNLDAVIVPGVTTADAIDILISRCMPYISVDDDASGGFLIQMKHTE